MIPTYVVGDRANSLLLELANPQDPVGRRDLTGDTLAFTLTSELGVVKDSAGTVTTQQVGSGIFAITALTNAFPAVVTLSSAAGLANDNRGVIERVKGMPEINGTEVVISGLSGSAFNATDVDSRQFGTYVTSGLFINRGFVGITFDADQVDEAGLFTLQVVRTTSGSLVAHYPVLHEQKVRFVEAAITVR